MRNGARIWTACVMLWAGWGSVAWGQEVGVRRGRWPGLVPTSPERMLERDSVVNQLAGASWSDGWELRNVGPTVMGGRVVDLAVKPGTGAEFYVAYASGGLWHTRNHGTSFTPCFDRESAMTIGAVAVDWTEVLRPGVGGSLGAGMPRRIWVGTGEVNSSRSSYAGTGIFVSDDGGRNWRHAGLEWAHHVGRIVQHPTQPDVAWVAVLGPLYTPNGAVGGVYQTRDAGATWTRQLAGSTPTTGAVDLVVDPTDPDHLYAAMWDRTRRAWDFRGTGAGSGIWESGDGGVSWNRISSPEWGFPDSQQGEVGRVGLAFHAGSGTLYALLDDHRPRPAKPADLALPADSVPALQPRDFLTMSATDWSALDSARLGRYLTDNGFPDSLSARRGRRTCTATSMGTGRMPQRGSERRRRRPWARRCGNGTLRVGRATRVGRVNEARAKAAGAGSRPTRGCWNLATAPTDTTSACCAWTPSTPSGSISVGCLC